MSEPHPPSKYSPPVVVTQLSWTFGIRPILQNLSFQIEAGARVGLFGANGSGKSTLMKCLLGLQAFDWGHVTLFGRDLDYIDDELRSRIAYVPQSPDLFPWLTVEQHLRVIGQSYPGWNEKRALELALGLELPLGKSVSKLSGGDQQKLAIALALAHQPDLIFMDEPVANLDPVRRNHFMRQLFVDHTWIAKEATVIFTSHLLNDLEDVLTQVIFLRNGDLQLDAAWPAFKYEHRLVNNKTLDALLASQPANQKIEDGAVIHRGKDYSLVNGAALATGGAQVPDSAFYPLTLDSLFQVLQQ